MYEGFTKVNFKKLDEANASIKKFKTSYNTVLRAVPTTKSIEVDLDPYIFLEVLEKTQQDIVRVNGEMSSGLNIFKKYGYFCYWIKRLKPFRKNPLFGHYTNEFLGFYYSLYMISKIKCSDAKIDVHDSFHGELYYLMRFENISKDGLSMIFTALYSDCHKKLYEEEKAKVKATKEEVTTN